MYSAPHSPLIYYSSTSPPKKQTHSFMRALKTVLFITFDAYSPVRIFPIRKFLLS